MYSNIAYLPMKNEENEERGSRSSSSTLSTSSTTRPRARNEETGNEKTLENVWKTDIAQYYFETFGVKMPPVAKFDVNDALEAGLEPVLVFRALDEAAIAPRPSWAYARAILKRLVNENCLTESAYNARQANWEAKKYKNNDPIPF